MLWRKIRQGRGSRTHDEKCFTKKMAFECRPKPDEAVCHVCFSFGKSTVCRGNKCKVNKEETCLPYSGNSSKKTKVGEGREIEELSAD